MGQGNMLLDNIYHNTSYLVIKILENKELGIIIVAPLIKKIEQEISVAFIDNTDFLQQE